MVHSVEIWIDETLALLEVREVITKNFVIEINTAWKVSQVRSFFWSVFSRIQIEYGEIEETSYLDTFHALKYQKQALTAAPNRGNQGINQTL